MSPAFKQRAEMLEQSRNFFRERNVMEVDCPILTSQASVDAHIDLFQTKESRFLHSSPEYGMKRLLVAGIGDIYQLSHVFRKGEAGPKHNPEFTLVEWYRLGFTFEDMCHETCDYIELFIGKQQRSVIAYEDAMRQYANTDYRLETEENLHLLMVDKVEPHLGTDGLTILIDYPATQGALSKREGDIAKRFEVYYRGMELANGYDELGDAHELRERFVAANLDRKARGLEELPLDEKFLQAMEEGLPPCCGVAVGFDRLLMLQLGAKNIQEVLPFSWPNA